LLAAFREHGTERVLIAFDRDEAGERGAAKVAERLLAEGIDCYRLLFPKGMDANEYALKVTPATKSLGLLIRKAAWLGKGRAGNSGGAAACPRSDLSVQAEVRTASEPRRVLWKPHRWTSWRQCLGDARRSFLSGRCAGEARPACLAADPSLSSLAALPETASPVPPPPSAEIPVEITENAIHSPSANAATACAAWPRTLAAK